MSSLKRNDVTVDRHGLSLLLVRLKGRGGEEEKRTFDGW